MRVVAFFSGPLFWRRLGLMTWLAMVVSYALMLGFSSTFEGGGPVLLNAHEAKQLRLTEREWRQVPRTRALSAGPIVVVQEPQLIVSDVPTIDATTPIDFDVLFKPRASPVDMGSLDIEARKGFFAKSLTPMLKPYIHGTELQVQKADIPPGRFILEISIADQSGNTTTEIYRLEISRP
jgi:hypothetical protein